MAERYVLATGVEGARRLAVVDSVHGPDTRAFLQAAGLRAGMRVADIGCGTGRIACWMAQTVGERGRVVGVDVSEGQVAQARQGAREQGVSNAEFRQASAYETKLEGDDFDLVFSRFVLMHLQRPADALAEMRRLLKPGGMLAVEDGDFAAPFCYPTAPAYDRCFELYRQMGARAGADFHIGPKLYGMARNAGFRDVEARLAQPLFTRGEPKRLPAWTLEEMGDAPIEAGLTTREELNSLQTELERLAENEGVMFGMARMTQIWARK